MSPCARCAGRALQLTVIVWELPLPVRWQIVTLPEHGVIVIDGVTLTRTVDVRVALACTVEVRVALACVVDVALICTVEVRVALA